ncbi:hypothetical protein IAR55_007170 [Kwoniella newhampshirensis]|uniref:Methyltransferase domain-containing protein n=1 Tax=Kwoniella newhampshirensis TaxID=1651941 RepID=A0AAW0YD94_9TREE
MSEVPETYQDGREYNTTQKNYPLPADRMEVDRLHAQHRAVTMLFGSLLPSQILTPLKAKQHVRILDVGCGTGHWAIELASVLPLAKITGIDLVSIHASTYPSNVDFLQQDILQPFPQAWEGAFDLVHARFLITGIRDFPTLLTRLGNLLKPSGHLLIVEPEVTSESADKDVPLEMVCPDIVKLGKVTREAMLKFGIDIYAALNIPRYLDQSGSFGPVEAKRQLLPMSPWSDEPHLKQIGSTQLTNSLAMPDTVRRLVLATSVITESEYDSLKAGFIQEMQEAKGKVVLPICSVWASRL